MDQTRKPIIGGLKRQATVQDEVRDNGGQSKKHQPGISHLSPLVITNYPLSADSQESSELSAEKIECAEGGLPRSCFGDQAVLFIVGIEKEEFIIHKRLLKNKIPNYNGFENEYASDPENLNVDSRMTELKILDMHPGAFSYFQHFIYRDNIPSVYSLKACNRLQGLYCLGEKHDMIELMDRVIDQIEEFFVRQKWKLTSNQISEFYLHVGERSKLREFHAAAWARLLVQVDHNYRREDSYRNLYERNPELFLDFFLHFAKNHEEMAANAGLEIKTYGSSRCHFHSHGDREKCYWEKKFVLD